MLASGPGARSPRQIWPLGPDAETAPHRPDPAQDRASTAGCRDLAAWHGCLNPPTRCTGGQPAAALGQQQGGAPRRHGLVRPLTDPRDRLPQDLLRPPGGVLLRCGSFRPLNLAHDDLARRRFALAAARPVAPPPRQLLLPLLLSQHGVGRQRAAHRGRGVGPAPRQAGAILLVPDALLVTGQHQVLAAARRHGQVQGGASALPWSPAAVAGHALTCLSAEGPDHGQAAAHGGYDARLEEGERTAGRRDRHALGGWPRVPPLRQPA
jgi:hypothetical protein